MKPIPGDNPKEFDREAAQREADEKMDALRDALKTGDVPSGVRERAERVAKRGLLLVRCRNCKRAAEPSIGECPFCGGEWGDEEWVVPASDLETAEQRIEKLEREVERDNEAIEAYRKERDWLDEKLIEAERG